MQLSTRLISLIRILPSWWRWRVYSRLVKDVYGDKGFSPDLKRKRLSPHGYEIDLCAQNWMERYALLVGCHYEGSTTATLRRLLRPGDWFIDVGANVGLITLTAASLVGKVGRVIAFEPNPALSHRLQKTIALNKLNQVAVKAVALGDTNGSALLNTGVQHGTGSLRSGIGEHVVVRKGDEEIGPIPADKWALVKIDVEGYELNVLRGLPELIGRPKTAFLIEITDSWLREAGGSAAELFVMMKEAGHSVFRAEMTRRSQLSIIPLREWTEEYQYDALFFRESDHWLAR